jgi:hypothetical protein
VLADESGGTCVWGTSTFLVRENETSESQVVLPAPQLWADLTVDALRRSFYSAHQTKPNHRPRKLAVAWLGAVCVSQAARGARLPGSRARRADRSARG